MTPGAPLTTGRALGLGWRTALVSWRTYLGAFVAAWIAALAALAAGEWLWPLLAGVPGRAVAAGVLGFGLLWLTASLLRAICLGAGAHQAVSRLREREVPGDAASLARAASPSLAWFGVGGLLELFWSAWQALAFTTAGVAYLRALVGGTQAVTSALLLALAGVLALVLGIALRLWLDVAWARALSREEGFLVALFETAGSLWARPWPWLIALLCTGAAAFAGRMVAAFVPGRLLGPGGVQGLWLAGALIGTALVAFIDTGSMLWRLGAFAALTLDEGGLLPRPPPARAELILEAEPVLEARALPEPPAP
jgi:hypothetical protein